MPTIVRMKRKGPSDRTKFRQSMYGKTEYRTLRNWYVKCHPLCELCWADGITEAGVEVHHKLSFCDINISKEESYRRLMNENNLINLCNYHHRLMHHTTSKEEDKEYELKKQLAKNYEENIDNFDYSDISPFDGVLQDN